MDLEIPPDTNRILRPDFKLTSVAPAFYGHYDSIKMEVRYFYGYIFTSYKLEEALWTSLWHVSSIISTQKTFLFSEIFISFAMKAKIADTRRSIIYKLLFVYVNVEKYVRKRKKLLYHKH